MSLKFIHKPLNQPLNQPLDQQLNQPLDLQLDLQLDQPMEEVSQPLDLQEEVCQSVEEVKLEMPVRPNVGIINLMAIGAQDRYLLGEPQIKYYKKKT